jgi:hypothetical protein
MFVMLIALLVAVATEGWSTETDGPFIAGLIGAMVLGAGAGALVGAVKHGLAALFYGDDDWPEDAINPDVSDPWAVPVICCEQSAKAVVRLLESLPSSAAGEWPAQIVETMAIKLGDLRKLADAGRAAVPPVDGKAVRAAKKHPSYWVLQRSADEFAEVADEIGKVMAKLHSPLGLEEIRTQLRVLTERLPR